MIPLKRWWQCQGGPHTLGVFPSKLAPRSPFSVDSSLLMSVRKCGGTCSTKPHLVSLVIYSGHDAKWAILSRRLPRWPPYWYSGACNLCRAQGNCFVGWCFFAVSALSFGNSLGVNLEYVEKVLHLRFACLRCRPLGGGLYTVQGDFW